MRIRIFLLTIVFLLLLSTFVPVSSQLFDDSDVKDPQGVLDHFRSRIKQVRNVSISNSTSLQTKGETSDTSHSHLGLQCPGLPLLGGSV